MKALTFQGPRRIGYTDVADPKITDSRDVILKTRWSAICGSDLHVYHQRERGIEPGTVMGHEFVGEVVELGKDVQSLSVGDLVVAPFTTNCGVCFYCRVGLTCRCSRGQLFGWVEAGKGLEGGQAELVRVPHAEATLVKLAPELGEETALLAGDVASTGFFSAELAGVRPGGTYAVVGCGPVGLSAILGAREFGAEELFACDSVARRLELAEKLGASAIDIRSNDPVAIVKDATEGRGVDAVMELVGNPEATRLAYDLVRPGGVLSAVGVHTEPQFAITPAEAYDKNLTYRAGRCPARRLMKQALTLIASKRYDYDAIISHRLPLAEGVRGYQIFDQKLEDCTKVLLKV